MDIYHVAFLIPCKECGALKSKKYYTNLLLNLLKKLKSSLHGGQSLETMHCGLPAIIFDTCRMFFQLAVPDKSIDYENTGKEAEGIVNHCGDRGNWTNLSDNSRDDFEFTTLLNRLEEFVSNNHNVKDQEKTVENIAEWLHEIADHLPSTSLKLNIYWLICEHTGCLDVRDNIPLYGALKRLYMWNSAYITWVFDAESEFCHSNFESWSDVLDIHSTNVEHMMLPFNSNIVWRGSIISVQDQQAFKNLNLMPESNWNLSRVNKSPSLKFSMTATNRIVMDGNKTTKSKQEVLKDKVTVICELRRSNIPLWKIFPCEFILYHDTLEKRMFQIEKFSNLYEESKNKNEETVLLASLESCFHIIGKSKSKTRTTKDWLEFVRIGLPDEPKGNDKEQDSPKTIETFYLLLYPVEPGIFNVYFLRPEESLQNLHSMLSVHGASFPLGKPTQEAIDKLRTDMNSLPRFSTKIFEQWMTEFDEACYLSFTQRLSNAKDKVDNEGRVRLSSSELWGIAVSSYTETRKTHSLPSVVSVDEGPLFESDCPSPCTAEHILPDDPEICPERQWLKWMNSISGVAPSPLKSQFSLAVHLDASEMLKHFTKDGKPLKKELESLRKQIEEKRKNPQATQAEEPSGMKLGIDYCVNDRTPASPKLLPVHVKHETLSICNTPKTLAKAKLQGTKRKAVSESTSEKITNKVEKTTEAPSTKQIEPSNPKAKKAKFVPKVVPSTLAKKTSISQTKAEPKQQADKDSVPDSRKACSSKNTKSQKKKRRSFDGSETSLSQADPRKKETRSERHKRRLARVVKRALTKYGVDPNEDYFETCSQRLYYLCKSFLKDLKTSEGLNNEMKRLAESNVANVVGFEKRQRATKHPETKT